MPTNPERYDDPLMQSVPAMGFFGAYGNSVRKVCLSIGEIENKKGTGLTRYRTL